MNVELSLQITEQTIIALVSILSLILTILQEMRHKHHNENTQHNLTYQVLKVWGIIKTIFKK